MPNQDIQIKSFTGGMNKDLDYSILPENVYTHAENYKLIAKEDSNGYILETAEGNHSWLDLTSIVGSGYYIAGHTYISPYLVLFVTRNRTETTPDATGVSKIIRVRVGRDLKQQVSTIYTDSAALGYLNLSVTHPIKAVGVYESEDIIHVYWSDGYNEDRFCNIMDPDISNQTVDKFSMIPDFPDVSSISSTTDTRLDFVEYIGGNLKASKVQYTYQYYNVNGATTRYAPLSRPIPVAYGDPDGSQTSFKGGDAGEYTGHGCKLKLNIPAVKEYDRVRLVALDYSALTDVPVVRVFEERIIDTTSTSTSLYIRDVGNTINELLYEDFLVYGNVTYTSKDLTVKNNILFKGNIKEEVFDVDFDARAYRHDSTGVARLYDSQGSYIDVDDGTLVDFVDVPETHDCINYYNDPTYEGNASYQYKYQADGSTFGAEGENIKIGFAVNQLTIDNAGIADYSVCNTASPDAGDNPADPYNVVYNTSMQRHEVYRLGIIFFNTKLQVSKVKWSCDLKMPRHYDDALLTYRFSQVSSDDTISNVLGLTVTLKAGAMPDDAYAWQLVYVKRESEDRSVIANGILQSALGNDAATSPPNHTLYYPAGDPAGSTSNPTLTTEAELQDEDYSEEALMFISPEVNFNQNLTYKTGDYLQYNGYFTYAEGSNSYQVGSAEWAVSKLNQFTGAGDYATSTYKSTLSDVKIYNQIASPADNLDILSYVENIVNIPYVNYTGGGIGSDYRGVHGTIAMCYSSAHMEPSTNSGRIPYVSYRRNVFESQYGGVDYYSRQYNEYVGCSPLLYAEGTITTYEGDTNIDYFYYIAQSVDLINDDGSWFHSILFPTETSIVLGLRQDVKATNSNSSLLREIAGTYEAEKGDGIADDLYYVQEKDAYIYNSVYSFYGSGQIYMSTVLDASDETNFPTRIIHSDTKLNGELQDSFTIFRANNFIDVDGSHGAVNNILNFNNNLYFWQDSAFGILSVNTRSLVQDNNPGILALGTGGVLDRYDYLSTSTGNQNPYGIVTSNKFIYWTDINKNEIYKFTGIDEPLSKTKGLQTWLNEQGKLGWVIGVYDQKYNDVIFTMSFSRLATKAPVASGYVLSDTTGLDTSGATTYNVVVDGRYSSLLMDPTNNTFVLSGSIAYLDNDMNPVPNTSDSFYFDIKKDPTYTYTVSYSEQIDSFVSFLSYEPRRYITLDKSFLSTNNDYHLYRHNDPSATRATYYGTTYDSIVETVFNKSYAYTKVFDVIKWLSDSRDSNNINIFKNTFSEVTISNDYQHTGNRALYYQHDAAPATRPTPISRRERTWSMQVPRNIVNADVDTNPDITDTGNWDDTQTNKERIRDKYMKVSFTYDNSDGYKFSVPFVSTTFRKSFR